MRGLGGRTCTRSSSSRMYSAEDRKPPCACLPWVRVRVRLGLGVGQKAAVHVLALPAAADRSMSVRRAGAVQACARCVFLPVRQRPSGEGSAEGPARVRVRGVGYLTVEAPALARGGHFDGVGDHVRDAVLKGEGAADRDHHALLRGEGSGEGSGEGGGEGEGEGAE